MSKLHKRLFLSVIMLLLVIIPAASNMAQERVQAGPAPTNLSPDATTLTTIPAKPDFTWENDLTAVEYRVFVRDGAAATILDEIVDKGLNCLTEGSIDFCGLYADGYTLPGWGLLNGNYEWWVGAKYPDNTWTWSAMATFTVDVPGPSLPSSITILTDDGRPTVLFANPTNTYWVQIWIGPNPAGAYFDWHERSGAGKNFVCLDLCWIYPEWDVPSKDANGRPYTMSVWMRSWGPGGFSTGGPEFDEWNQLSSVNGNPATTFQLPQDPAPIPTGLTQSGGTAADPGFIWTGGPGTTWYNLVLATSSAPITVAHNEWYVAASPDSVIECLGAMGADDYDCAISGLGLDSVLDPATEYTPYVRAWGPGGMSDWHTGTPFIYTPA